MAIHVTIHPAARTGLKLVATALAVAIPLGFVLRGAPPKAEPPKTLAAVRGLDAGTDAATLLGALDLCVPESAREAEWIAATASRLSGQPEVSIPNGRVDIVTDRFAIEIDWAAKWHEGIGQSLHYADATGRRAALGLIVDGNGEDGGAALRHVRAADDVASSRGIRVFMLRRRCPQ